MDTQQLNQKIQELIDSQDELICQSSFYKDDCQLVFWGYPRNVGVILKAIDSIKWINHEEVGTIDGISEKTAALILHEIARQTGIKFHGMLMPRNELTKSYEKLLKPLRQKYGR